MVWEYERQGQMILGEYQWSRGFTLMPFNQEGGSIGGAGRLLYPAPPIMCCQDIRLVRARSRSDPA